jgi:FixJ family two-component response regulator
VLILDDDDDVRSAIAEVLQLLLGKAAVTFRSVEELKANAGAALGCQAALLDINLGPGAPSGVDAYRWLRDHGFAGPVFFLTGHAATHPEVARAHALGDARVVAKPVGIEELSQLLGGGARP